MLKRLMSLTTLLVLCGVLALSVPATADRNSQVTKVTTPTVTVVKTTTTSSATKSEFVRTGWKDGLRFWLHNWLGWPYIPVVDPKPAVPDEPQKSGPGLRPRWMDEAVRDHGGNGEDS
jgi:hypothetical protein